MKNEVLFVVGTGRCGTKFLHEVYKKEKNVVSTHERYPLMEAFQRYCTWYGLEVDRGGFLNVLKTGISEDLRRKRFSVESSAYLSFDIDFLAENLNCKVLMMVRSPEKVVNSYVNKGWYDLDYVQHNPNIALGFQGYEYGHHNFSRIAPIGGSFNEWKKLGRVGKLSWLWAEFNRKVLQVSQNISSERFKVMRLEDLDFGGYVSLCDWAGIDSTLTLKQFDKLVSKKPNSIPARFSSQDWSSNDRDQFEYYTRDMAKNLDY